MKALAFPILSLCLTAAGLAQDPTPPPGGFAIKRVPDTLITYSDGYRTRVDVRYPTVQRPTKGWPAIMVFHGGGGGRNESWVVNICERMAQQGYVSIAYDTGGNGVTAQLNPNGGSRDEVLRIRDIAEMFAQVEKAHAPLIDEDRLCAMGKSGGGKHTLWMMSYAGRKLPKGGAVTHMPNVTCVHADLLALDFVADKLPGGNMIQSKWAALMYESLGASHPIVKAMIAHDFAALTGYLRSPASGGYFPGLPQSDIPLVVSYAWDDANHNVNVNPDALRKFKSGVPRRYVLITGGHNSAGNDYAVNVRRDFTQRWCDRFAKGIQNGVDKEPFAEVSVLPSSPADYQKRSTPWKHRWSTEWPPATSPQRLWLRGNGKLSAHPPAAVESGPTVQHRVAQGYGMVDFMKDKADPTAVLRKVPLSAHAFDLPRPMTSALEVFGRGRCSLEVVTTGKSFQLQAALLDVPPSGAPRFITSGVASRWNVTPGRHRLEITLGDIAYVLPKGHKLRLQLENLYLRRHPGNPNLFAAPYFESVDMRVQIDPSFAPRIDVPLRTPPSALVPRLDNAFASKGIAHTLVVDGEVQRAGQPYMVFCSATGVAPGITLAPRLHIPLNLDIWTRLGIALVNTPVFPSFLGVLDGAGRAKPRFVLPQGWAKDIAGTRLSFAALLFDQNGNISVTHPAELVIHP